MSLNFPRGHGLQEARGGPVRPGWWTVLWRTVSKTLGKCMQDPLLCTAARAWRCHAGTIRSW